MTPADRYGVADYPYAVQSTVLDAQKSILKQIEIIRNLAEVASKYPYYKYNALWTRDIQNTVRGIN
jgi:hypothetical protein